MPVLAIFSVTRYHLVLVPMDLSVSKFSPHPLVFSNRGVIGDKNNISYEQSYKL